ncbi:MAG TPA: hypothetical protein VF284_09955 [Rhodanobacteraceae bacterium]
MATLPLFIAVAAVGGSINFSGAVVTPTVQNVATITTALSHGKSAATAHLERKDGPPRMVKINPPKQAGGHSEVIVTYL